VNEYKLALLLYPKFRKKIFGSIGQTNKRDVHSLADENRKLRSQTSGTDEVMKIDKMIGASICFMTFYC
jgi:hypothetical protein